MCKALALCTDMHVCTVTKVNGLNWKNKTNMSDKQGLPNCT